MNKMRTTRTLAPAARKTRSSLHKLSSSCSWRRISCWRVLRGAAGGGRVWVVARLSTSGMFFDTFFHAVGDVGGVDKMHASVLFVLTLVPIDSWLVVPLSTCADSNVSGASRCQRNTWGRVQCAQHHRNVWVGFQAAMARSRPLQCPARTGQGFCKVLPRDVFPRGVRRQVMSHSCCIKTI